MTVVLLLLDTVVLLQVQVVLLSLVIVPSLDTVFDEEDCEEQYKYKRLIPRIE